MYKNVWIVVVWDKLRHKANDIVVSLTSVFAKPIKSVVGKKYCFSGSDNYTWSTRACGEPSDYRVPLTGEFRWSCFDQILGGIVIFFAFGDSFGLPAFSIRSYCGGFVFFYAVVSC